MRILACILALFLFMSVSLCWANSASVREAYNLYYKGEKEAAIDIMEEYVREKPDPKAFYFLGYAYYENEELDKARDYFNEAFRLKSFYSPMGPEDTQ